MAFAVSCVDAPVPEIIDNDEDFAVGTVVMNRVKSDKFPNTVCGVVGQKNQFAPGVLSKPMKDSGKPRAERMAAGLTH